MIKLYSAYDDEYKEWFSLSLEEYPENGMIKSPFNQKEYPICPKTLNFKINLNSKGSNRSNSGNSGYIIDKTPKTLGGLADQNSREMKSEIADRKILERQKIVEQRLKDADKIPKGGKINVDAILSGGESEVPWRDSKKPVLSLSKLRGAEIEKYCVTGKKPIGLDERK